MEIIGVAFNRAMSYLGSMKLADFIDIVIVAYILYKSIWFVRKTNSINLAKGIVLIIIALWISEIFELTMINYLLRKAVELGLIAVLILFQPELRRLLERVGSTISNGKASSSTVLEEAIQQTVEACTDMSKSRTGALIIFERSVNLTHIMSTGTFINSDVSAELLKNIFFNKAPLHDGAVIVRDAKIAAAGCVLPLTQMINLSKDLGMRHRAGIGMSENSDAVVVIVSEETGAVSVAIDGMLKRHLSPEKLDEILHNELVKTEEESGGFRFFTNLKKRAGKVINFGENNNDE
jgi:diadenylate cyclase